MQEVKPEQIKTDIPASDVTDHGSDTTMLTLYQSKYQSNGETALFLRSVKGPYMTITVNLPDVDLDDDEVSIKNYSENEGVFEWLVDEGIVSEPIRYEHQGHVKVPICRLLEKAD